MFRINLKIALRNLLKHRTASLINISGLGIGLGIGLAACCCCCCMSSTSGAITGMATIAIAMLTVSWQAYRAAMTNPVDALKYE